MAIKINSWKPDTCSCTIHYYWDDSVPQDQITTTFFGIENACPEHQHLATLANGEPDWVQPDHSIDAENAARFAMVGDILDTNEQNNLATIPEEERPRVAASLQAHKQNVIDRYSKLFAVTNERAISKGIWNSVDEENKRKNRAIDEIVQRAPDIYVDIAPDGTRTLKQGITIDFQWSGSAPNRIIKMIVTGVKLPQNHFDALQTRLNTRFGAGRVILENPG